MKPARTLFVLTVLLTLSACGNAPQQPSDVIDRRTADAPVNDLDPAISPDFEDLGDNPAPGLDPVETASIPAPSTNLSMIAGRWGVDDSACASGGDVTISTTTFEGAGRICDIASAVDGGNGSVTATLSCPRADGIAGDGELLKLSPEAGGLSISLVGGVEPPQTYVRCP